MWSGVWRARPIKPIREATKPSVCLNGRWKTVLKVSAVTIAKSEYLRCPPGRPLGGAFQAQIDSSSNQTVMSPRSLRAISYAGQFFTRYFVSLVLRGHPGLRPDCHQRILLEYRSTSETGSPGPSAMSSQESCTNAMDISSSVHLCTLPSAHLPAYIRRRWLAVRRREPRARPCPVDMMGTCGHFCENRRPARLRSRKARRGDSRDLQAIG